MTFCLCVCPPLSILCKSYIIFFVSCMWFSAPPIPCLKAALVWGISCPHVVAVRAFLWVVLARHHGKPDAALNSVKLDLIKGCLCGSRWHARSRKIKRPKTKYTCLTPVKTVKHKQFLGGFVCFLRGRETSTSERAKSSSLAKC